MPHDDDLELPFMHATMTVVYRQYWVYSATTTSIPTPKISRHPSLYTCDSILRYREPVRTGRDMAGGSRGRKVEMSE